MSATAEECWQKAFKAVREYFEIVNLPPEQENALREFLGGQNIFVSFPQKRNGIVFSLGINYLHTGGNIQSEESS